MKKLCTIFSFLIFSGWAHAEPLKQVFNPFTGKQDYITRMDSNTVVAGANCTTTSNSNGTVTVTCTGSGGSGVTVYPATATASFPFGFTVSTITAGSLTSTTLGNNPYGVFSASGTSQAVQVNINGRPSGGEQNQIGGMTINGPSDVNSGFSPALLVLADSTTNATNGAGLLEIWEGATAHNSYLLWIHGMSTRNSDEPIRFDGPTYGIDEVSTSTDAAHGIGKWKVISMAYASNKLQVASPRAWDNSTFEHEIEVYPLAQTVNLPGFYMSPQSLDNDSGILTSSDTTGITFQGLNGSAVGLTGALNPNASYTFALPSTVGAQGQVLYHNGNRGKNFNVRQMEWTTGGSAGQVLTYQGTSAPTWTTVSGSGGGASSLGVFQDGVQIASPTAQINLFGKDFNTFLQGTTTAYISLNSGTTDFIWNTTSAQSATLDVSSGTISNFTAADSTSTNISANSIRLLNQGNTRIVFMNGNNLASSSNFTWNGATLTMPNLTATGTALLSVAGSTVTIQGISNLTGTVNISSGVQLNGQTGTNGQVMTSGGPSTTPTWTTVSATPGGASTNVQFNSGSAFSGNNFFQYSGSSITMLAPLTVSATSQSTIVSFSTSPTGSMFVAVSSTVATAPSDFLLTVSSVDKTMDFGVQNDGHIISSGTTPSMGTCGVSPSVNGTDNAGVITAGSGVVTSCTLNFAYAWANPPVCVESDNSVAITGDVSSISTTSVTFSFSASLGSGLIYYICFGEKG